MLTESQINDVWEGQISSEVRSLYFADLAGLYSSRKQLITGISFFFSSGAVATLIARLPIAIPTVLSLIVALATAYAVAVNLDSKIRTMAKLHSGWTQLSSAYNDLWNHTYREGAEAQLADLQRREMELSGLAATDAPNDQQRMGRWQTQVFQMRRLENA